MPGPDRPRSLLLCRDTHHRPAGTGLGQGLGGAGWGWPRGPGYRARRAREPREGAARRGPAQAGGFSPAPPHATRERGARPPPAAGPHVVDDHGLVGDDVVGLHGRAGPGRPCPTGRRQERPADARAGGPDSSSSGSGAAALPPGARSLGSRPERAAYASREGAPRSQSPLPPVRRTARAPGPAAGEGKEPQKPASQLQPRG